MNILTFFTSDGVPKEGLSPVIKIIDVSTGLIVINWFAMDEISDGWYKYDFVAYDYKQEYVVVCDGGFELSGAERFIASASDNSRQEIPKLVWSSKVDDYQEVDTFGKKFKEISSDLKRTLGLLHENIFIDMPSYDEFNNLVGGRVRIYSDAVNVGTDIGVIGTYSITSTGTGPGKFDNWSQIKI